MTEQEFKVKFEAEKHIFEEWGYVIANEITGVLSGKGYDLSQFLKVQPEPRIKGIDSIISKAYYRGKPYKDPYNDITDKVGVRFVVLFIEEIRIIEDIIVSSNTWSYSKDKDFEKEKLDNPSVFIYQSQHYILTNKEILKRDKCVIPVGATCEVQIRSLLQHAYSELTHDTIYKPSFKVPPESHRLAARSMALIETTDNIFSEVNDKLEGLMKDRNKYIEELSIIYNEKDLIIENNVNEFLLNVYKDYKSISIDDIKSFFEKNPELLENIKSKSKDNLLFSQPIILLLYYLFDKKGMEAKKYWPFEADKMSLITNDLGRG